MSEPIECPTCGERNWTQTQDYGATDRHWLTYDTSLPGGEYVFSYEQIATSDENTNRWECSNGHEADDEIEAELNNADWRDGGTP